LSDSQTRRDCRARPLIETTNNDRSVFAAAATGHQRRGRRRRHDQAAADRGRPAGADQRLTFWFPSSLFTLSCYLKQEALMGIRLSAMRGRCAILFGLLGLSVPASQLYAEDSPVKKEDLRYSGKSFDQWRLYLRTELNPKMRIEALDAFTAFGTHGYAKEATHAILESIRKSDSQDLQFDDKEGGFAVNAISALAGIGPQAVPQLKAAFKDKNPCVRRVALGGLWWVEEDRAAGIRNLIEALNDEEKSIRHDAVDTMAVAGEGNRKHILSIRAGLEQARKRAHLLKDTELEDKITEALSQPSLELSPDDPTRKRPAKR
jgi:hypothetical protein